jgi:excisionase family DNA binding protein
MGADVPSQYLNTVQAAKILAVSVSTVKRWVDGGILPAHITAGGHRKLLRSEVLALARQGELPRGELTVLDTTDAELVENTSVLSNSLFDALMNGRGDDASSLLRQAYEAGLSIELLADQVIAPAMGQVGHQWELSRIDVWHEHRATQLCAAALNDLKRELELRAERNRPIAVGSAPEGDHYPLPTLLAQLVLLDAGWEAINLGPNTPLTSLSKAVGELQPRLVWLSVSFIQNVEEFLSAYRDLYRAVEHHQTPIAVGGQALVGTVRASMSYTTYGDGLRHLAAFARTLHPRPKRPRRGRPRTDSR